MTVESKSSVRAHGWINQIKAMRKWLGERTVNNLASSKIVVPNVKFENTFELTCDEFQDDEYDMYKIGIPALASDALKTQDRMLVDALLKGTTDVWAGDDPVLANCLPFFGTTRKFGDATISNYSTTAYAEDGSALNTAVAAMQSFQGHGGQPLYVRPTAIVHGPGLRVKVEKSLSTYGALLASATQVGGQIGNPNANLGIVPVQCPYLVNGYVDMDGNTYANAGTYWFLLGEIMGIKGPVYQSRLEPMIQDQRARFDSEFAFQFDKLQWGVKMRGAAFLSMPQLIIGNFATA